MPMIDFAQMPARARLWIFAAERPLHETAGGVVADHRKRVGITPQAGGLSQCVGRHAADRNQRCVVAKPGLPPGQAFHHVQVIHHTQSEADDAPKLQGGAPWGQPGFLRERVLLPERRRIR